MNITSLLALSPFLAVLYVAFALIQALRKKQQGFGAALLAFIALAVPFAALLLSGDATVKASITNYLTLNAVIVFVASMIVLLIERGNKARAANRSYGMLGIGLGVLLAVEIFVFPLLGGASTGATPDVSALLGTRGESSTLQNVAVQDTSSTEATAFALVVAEQSGLTAEEITTQLAAGKTVAELVATNSGDVDVVIQAAATAIDDLKSQAGMAAQMFANMQGDSSSIATQFVQSELGERAQQLLTTILLSGGMPMPPGGAAGGFPPDGAAGGGFPPGGAGAAPSGENAPADIPGQGGVQVASQPTAQPTTSSATPTEPVIRPTVISFPSVTPTSITQIDSAEATTEAIDELTTCSISVIYNLNLRDQPSTDSTIYLSIPFGTTVVTDGRTADNWYRVSYDGQTGWVSGEFVSAGASCADIAVIEAD